MHKPISFAPQARDEVNAAARRYGEERPELRVEFHAAIKEALDRMVRLSAHLGTPPLVPPGLGIKRVFVERFPFSCTSRSCRPASASWRSPTRVGSRSTGAVDGEVSACAWLAPA